LRRITGASQLVALTARLLCCGVSVRSLRYFCRVHAACGMRAALKLRMPAVVKMSGHRSAQHASVRDRDPFAAHGRQALIATREWGER
jgi:hypothetical protein